MAQYQGVVKWFNNVKGYGFLGRSGQPDVFVHYSSIQQVEGYRFLKEGEPVSFDVIEGTQGPQADNVQRLRVRNRKLESQEPERRPAEGDERAA